MMATLTITLCYTSFLAVYSVLGAASERKNGFIKMKSGETFTIECKTVDNTRYDSLKLYARLPSMHLVGFYDNHTKSFSSKEYTKRVKISGPIDKLTISISDMQLDDSGLYIGCYSKFDKNQEVEEEGCSTLLFVNDVDTSPSPMSEPLVLVFALTACTMLVVCFLVIWVLAPKVKAQCVNQADDASREYNPVYEDMHRVQNK